MARKRKGPAKGATFVPGHVLLASACKHITSRECCKPFLKGS